MLLPCWPPEKLAGRRRTPFDGGQLSWGHHPIFVNGTELIRDLRRRNLQFPIVMVSGNPNAEREARSAGASAFVLKTITMEELEMTVRDFLAS